MNSLWSEGNGAFQCKIKVTKMWTTAQSLPVSQRKGYTLLNRQAKTPRCLATSFENPLLFCNDHETDYSKIALPNGLITLTNAG